MTNEKRRSDNIEILAKAVEADLTSEWTKKTSLETRAGSVIVASGAMVTLFLTLRQALGIQKELSEGLASALVIVGLCLAAAALIDGVITALPLRYDSLDANYYRVLLRDDLDRDDLRQQLIDDRAAVLSDAISSNGVKSGFLLVGFVLLGLALASLTVAVLLGTELIVWG